MKIGFFTDGYLPQPNGVATSVAASVKELVRRGHDVYVVAPKQPGFKDEKNVFRLTSVKIYGKEDFRLALNLPEKPLREVLRKDFDIIHGHAGGPVTFLGWQIARLKNIPFVATYHTLWNRYTHYILKGKLISPKAAEVASKVFGNLCDYLIAPTPRVKKELVSYGVKKPIVVIGSGLDLTNFINIKKGYIRNRFHIKEEEKILIFVGRLGKEKSVEFLLSAFEFIYEKDKNSRLILVGDGPDRSKLEQSAKRMKSKKNVHFAGHVLNKDIPKAYADADIFVFSSQTETQGLVVIEAFASGLPVVAVKDPVFDKVVEDGGNGYLVKKDPKIFSKKVLGLLKNNDERQKFSQNALQTADKFSVKVSTEKLEKFYKRVLKEHKKKKRLTEKIKDLQKLLDISIQINRLKTILIPPYFEGKNDS